MIFPCEILPSCSSLSTSNLSEIMKNVHVFLIKTANSLPTDNVWWIDSNSYSQGGMFSKQEWSTDAFISLLISWRLTSLLVVTLKLTILLSVTHVNRTHFSAIPLRKSVTWLRCKHCMVIASSQAGQLLITFLQTKLAHKHFELIRHIEL